VSRPSLKVLTPTAVLYPHVLVTCRPLAPDDDRLSDPTAVVEVLSPASETFDRIYKWREYQRIASLRHYVLIEPGRPHSQIVRRGRIRPFQRHQHGLSNGGRLAMAVDDTCHGDRQAAPGIGS
jgi:Uma2 family endonuclease